MHDQLYRDALQMSVGQNLRDVQTLLAFAEAAEDPLEKARHIDSVITILRDVRVQLVASADG